MQISRRIPIGRIAKLKSSLCCKYLLKILGLRLARIGSILNLLEVLELRRLVVVARKLAAEGPASVSESSLQGTGHRARTQEQKRNVAFLHLSTRGLRFIARPSPPGAFYQFLLNEAALVAARFFYLSIDVSGSFQVFAYAGSLLDDQASQSCFFNGSAFRGAAGRIFSAVQGFIPG